MPRWQTNLTGGLVTERLYYPITAREYASRSPPLSGLIAFAFETRSDSAWDTHNYHHQMTPSLEQATITTQGPRNILRIIFRQITGAHLPWWRLNTENGDEWNRAAKLGEKRSPKH